MSNNAGPRKVNESRHLPKNSNSLHRTQQTKVKKLPSFEEILNIFLGATVDYEHQPQQATANAVRQLLGSLKAFAVRAQTDIPHPEDEEHIVLISEKTQQVMSRLDNIISSIDLLETVSLSSFGATFLLTAYYNYFKNQFQNFQMPRQIFLASGVIYFSMLKAKPELYDVEHLRAQFVSTEKEQFQAIIYYFDGLPKKNISFRYVALFAGFLNSIGLVEMVLSTTTTLFVQLFKFINCLMKENAVSVNCFHVVRLLDQYLKMLFEKRQLFKDQVQLLEFVETMRLVISETLPLLDASWESPVIGISPFIRSMYQYLVDLAKFATANTTDVKPFRLFLRSEFFRALRLPYSSKAKYRKLQILYQQLKPGDINEDGVFSIAQIPFRQDEHFGYAVFEHLSVNMLSSCIVDLYKTFVKHIFDCASDIPKVSGTDETAMAVHMWQDLWLQPMVAMFQTPEKNRSPALFNSAIVQNAVLAHIFPSTLASLPSAFLDLYEGFKNNTYGQVGLVRVSFERGLLGLGNKMINFNHIVLSPLHWLEMALIDGDDMTRSEALILLLEGRILDNEDDRVTITYRLLSDFIKNNMNVDDAPFRQKVLCKLEQFFDRTFESLESRMNAAHRAQAEDTTLMVSFLAKTFETVAKALAPGASFQSKYTALNILSFLLDDLKRIHRKLATTGNNEVMAIFQNYCNTMLKRASIGWFLLLCLVDKDDKIRRLCTEMITKYWQWSHTRPIEAIEGLDEQKLLDTAIGFLQSPRHHEAHIGGLLIKCLFRTKFRSLPQFEKGDNFLLWLTNRFGEAFKLNNVDLVQQSKQDPYHGWMLALNQCFTFDSIYEGIDLNEKDRTKDIMTNLRVIFQRLLAHSEEAIKYFLDLLTPNDSNGADDELFDDEDNLGSASSPSFYEMCQSIQAVLEKGKQTTKELSETKAADEPVIDISQSNDFRLILSMAWLNIKEACFILSATVNLFADLLIFFGAQPNSAELDLGEEPLFTPDELNRIGLLLVTVMLRCRHKGVIEACSLSLTKVVRYFLCIIANLKAPGLRSINLFSSSTLEADYKAKLDLFVEQIVNIVNEQTKIKEEATNSNITRRSAGLSLMVQAVLTGEANAITEGQQAFYGNADIYRRIIAILVENSKTPVADWQVSGVQQNDLPQANALHVLQSIVGTSILNPLTIKTSPDLMPLCIDGFDSPHWSLRNASLQLFGSCISRMVGQRKRTSAGKEDEMSVDSCGTITFREFENRYPQLVKEFVAYIEKATTTNAGHSDVVPILALFASFSPGNSDDPPEEILRILETFLVYPNWRIRMLAARAMASMQTLADLELYIEKALQFEEVLIPMPPNKLHGMLCCAEVLFDLKAATIFEGREETMMMFRNRISALFTPWMDKLSHIAQLFVFAVYIFSGQRAGPPVLEDQEGEEESATKIKDKDEEMEEGEEEAHSSTQSGEKLQKQLAIPILAAKVNSHNPATTNSIDLDWIESILSLEGDHQHRNKDDADYVLKRIQLNLATHKPDEVRLKAAKDLHQLVDKFELQCHRYQISLIGLLYLVDMLPKILEDEERAVRRQGQEIVYRLLMMGKIIALNRYPAQEGLRQTALSTSISVKRFYQWALAYAEEFSMTVELYHLLLLKLLLRFEPNDLETLLEANATDDDGDTKMDVGEALEEDKMEEASATPILFQKEERNVFAEPYRVVMLLAEVLEMINYDPREGMWGESLKALVEAKVGGLLKRSEALTKPIPIKRLLHLSIWRLPKVFAHLLTLQAFARLMHKENKLNEKIPWLFELYDLP